MWGKHRNGPAEPTNPDPGEESKILAARTFYLNSQVMKMYKDAQAKAILQPGKTLAQVAKDQIRKARIKLKARQDPEETEENKEETSPRHLRSNSAKPPNLEEARFSSKRAKTDPIPAAPNKTAHKHPKLTK